MPVASLGVDDQTPRPTRPGADHALTGSIGYSPGGRSPPGVGHGRDRRIRPQRAARRKPPSPAPPDPGRWWTCQRHDQTDPKLVPGQHDPPPELLYSKQSKPAAKIGSSDWVNAASASSLFWSSLDRAIACLRSRCQVVTGWSTGWSTGWWTGPAPDIWGLRCPNVAVAKCCGAVGSAGEMPTRVWPSWIERRQVLSAARDSWPATTGIFADSTLGW